MTRNKHANGKQRAANLCEKLKLRKQEDKSSQFALQQRRIHNSHPGGVTNQSFNAMSTHVSCLSLVNSPAGSYTVRSRPPADVYRGVETRMV